MGMELATKPCPICHEPMTVKAWSGKGEEVPFYSIYCHCCGYGLRNTFNSAIHAIQHWNEAAL